MDWMICKLHVCKLVLIEFVLSKQQQVNKHPKFDENFNIQRQLEHFEYEMIHALAMNTKTPNPEKFNWPLSNNAINFIFRR